jgi:hypothetical protein
MEERMNRRFVSALAAGLIAAVVAAMTLAGAAAAGQASSPSLAVFEGKQIDLSLGWGEAQACLVDRGAGVVECFRDRAGLLAREADLDAAAAPASVLASCSGPLRLFADSNYGGRELDFYDRGFWQNLSDWSFDNQLSSYKIGPCAAHLAENANGGGSWYPGNTSAGHNEPVMQSGWNDRVSSIFIQ